MPTTHDNDEILREFEIILEDAKELRAIKTELNADYTASDLAEWDARIVRAEKLLNQFKRQEEETRIRATIPEFTLLNDGSNPHGYRACAAQSGDRGIYEEVRIGVFHPDGHCVGDVLVGLTSDGEPRVMLTSNGNGDDEPSHAFYPMRDAARAIESLDSEYAAPSPGKWGAVADRVLDCSAAHVRPETMHQLLSMAQHNNHPWMISTYSEGCIMNVHPEAEEDKSLPADMQTVMAFARKNGCTMLRLDADGTRYGNLPEFEWDNIEQAAESGMSPG